LPDFNKKGFVIDFQCSVLLVACLEIVHQHT
jgi:hypothetical protein